jgi:hypothetical protein
LEHNAFTSIIEQERHMNMGKAYAHRTGNSIGDLYSTPKSLVLVAKDIITTEFPLAETILEPCYGEGSISEELERLGYTTAVNDLYRGGIDYLEPQALTSHKYVITNPPFSLWDKFTLKAKTHAHKIMLIGRLNYLGTNTRYKNGLWTNLKAIYPFNRYVDYQTPYRTDGLFHVGAMTTAWFLWDVEYESPPIIQILNTQQYAKLGNYHKN